MKLYLSLILSIFQLSTYAQERYVSAHLIDKKQLVVAQNKRNYFGYYWSPRFNDVFDNSYHWFYLPETDFYQQQKVRQIWVQDYQQDTAYSITLNEQGQIKEIYNRTYGLVVIEQFYYDKDGMQNLHTKRYKVNGVEARRDSVFFTISIYLASDTLFTYSTSVEKVYKTGARLNTQNAYYNHEFLNRSRKFEDWLGHPPGLDSIYAPTVDGIVYLKEAFKTDYPTDRFQLCTAHRIASPLAGTVISNKHALRKLQKHSVPKPQFYKGVKTYHAEGESFVEPSERKSNYVCGMASNRNERADEYAYLANEQGLHESYVSKVNNPYHVIYSFVYSFFE